MKKISINNGAHYIAPEDALKEVSMDDLVPYMENDVFEMLMRKCAFDSDEELLKKYLENAEEDLIFG